MSEQHVAAASSHGPPVLPRLDGKGVRVRWLESGASQFQENTTDYGKRPDGSNAVLRAVYGPYPANPRRNNWGAIAFVLGYNAYYAGYAVYPRIDFAFVTAQGFGILFRNNAGAAEMIVGASRVLETRRDAAAIVADGAWEPVPSLEEWRRREKPRP